MAIETAQEKNKRLTKEVQELKKALSDMTDIVINKDKEIDRMRKRAETDFAGSPTYLQMCEKIKRLNAEVTLAEKRIAVLQQRCSEYSQRSAAPDLKHNERGAGRKKALSEDQIAEFEELLLQGAGEKQLRERFGISRSSYFCTKRDWRKNNRYDMNVRKSENGVKRTREHKEFPAGNDSGLSDLDGMERLCCCRKETFCFRQLPQQQV